MAWTTIDITKANYENKSKSFSSLGNPFQLFFKPDGSKVYVDSGGTISQFSLSTAWDISTASSDSKSGSFQSSIEGFFMKSDGTRVYSQRSINNTIRFIDQWTLSTPWDISTLGSQVSLNISGSSGSVYGIYFKPDGTKLYFIFDDGSSHLTINQYALSSAWDLSTATSEKTYTETITSYTDNLFFNDIGTQLFICNFDSDTIRQYTLSTAWDISTASYDNKNFSIAAQDGTIRGLYFKMDDGAKFYILGQSTKTAYQYISTQVSQNSNFFQLF